MRNLTLVIPYLHAAITDASHLKLPALQKFLQRARIINQDKINFEQTLAKIICAQSQQSLPLAAVSAISDGLPAQQGWWLRADPVQLHADMAAVYLLGNQQLELELDEIKILAPDIQQLLPKEMQFYTPHPLRWYLHSAASIDVTTYPLAEVIGKEVSGFQISGKDSLNWQKLLTEIQMLLHQHSLNLQRQSNGKPPINSLWFWGEGTSVIARSEATWQSSINAGLPRRFAPRNDGIYALWQKIYVDSFLANSIANFIGKPSAQIDQNLSADDLMQNPPGNFLLIAERMREYYLQQNQTKYFELLYDLENNWFAPLLTKIAKHQVDTVTLYCDNGCYQMNRKCLRRWWW